MKFEDYIIIMLGFIAGNLLVIASQLIRIANHFSP